MPLKSAPWSVSSFLTSRPRLGLLEEHVLQQVRHARLAIAFVARAHQVSHVDRHLGLRSVGEKQDVQAVGQDVFGDALDGGDLLDALRQLLGECRERGDGEDGGKLGETQRLRIEVRLEEFSRIITGAGECLWLHEGKRQGKTGLHNRRCRRRLVAECSLSCRYFPMQKVEKMRFRMSSAVVAPVMASMGRSARVKVQQQHLVRDVGSTAPRAFSRYAADSRSSCSWRRLVMKPGLLLERARRARRLPGSRRAKLGDALAGQRRDGNRPDRRCPARSHLLPTTRCAACAARAISASSSAVERLRQDRPPPASDRHRPSPGSCARCPAIPPVPSPSRMPAVSYELHRNAADGRGLGDQVARGAGDVGDDGAVLFQQAIEQAALADVRPADDRQREALRAPGRRTGSWRPVARRPSRSGSRRRRISAPAARR